MAGGLFAEATSGWRSSPPYGAEVTSGSPYGPAFDRCAWRTLREPSGVLPYGVAFYNVLAIRLASNAQPRIRAQRIASGQMRHFR